VVVVVVQSPQASVDAYGQSVTVGPHEVTVTSSVTVTDQVLAEAAAAKPATMATVVRILVVWWLIVGFELPEIEKRASRSGRGLVLLNESGGAELERMDDRSQGLFWIQKSQLEYWEEEVEGIGQLKVLVVAAVPWEIGARASE
jgi:hypothetical protein